MTTWLVTPFNGAPPISITAASFYVQGDVLIFADAGGKNQEAFSEWTSVTLAPAPPAPATASA